MKKVISIVVLFLTFINPFTISFADSKIKIEKAKSIANEYIKNSFQDDNWKGKNPYIVGNGVYSYVDEDKPSYIEFKVSCDNNNDCGFIIVNIDGNDVGVPIASTIGATPSEALTQKGQEKNTKMYYFGPFEQYSENLVSGDIYSIDPQDYDSSLETNKTISTEEEKLRIKKLKDNIKYKFDNTKIEATKFKKSSEFKSKKEEIKKLKDSIPASEFSMKLLPMSYADEGLPNSNGYNPPSSSNIILPGGSSNTTCSGSTPCYSQFTTNNCKSGCSATAVGILYGYYDRNGKSNLIPGTAGLVNDYNITTMINNIRNLISTDCYGATNASNIPLAINYAKSKGYNNSTSVYSNIQSTSIIFSKIKNEINAGRPIIIGSNNHSMVAFGYNSNSSNIVRVNLGWGGTPTITGTNGLIYQTSNIDYNINSMYYNNANKPSINHYVTFNISN